MKKTITSLFCLVSFLHVSAQSAFKTGAYLVTDRNSTGAASHIKFLNNKALLDETFIAGLKKELLLSKDDELKQVKVENDELGFSHYRFQQYYKGIPVQGGEYLVHKKQDAIVVANGSVYGNIKTNIVPVITEAAALNSVLPQVGITKFKWEDKEAEEALRLRTGNPEASYYPKGTLVIAASNNDFSSAENFHLCWKFDIDGANFTESWTVFVNAENGDLVNVLPNVCSTGADVAGSTKTRYNGIRPIICYKDTADTVGTYTLRQVTGINASGPQEVQVYNYKNGTKQAPVDRKLLNPIKNDSSFFAKDSIAGETYWGLQQTANFYESTFQRHSVDDKYHKLIGLAHFSTNYGNANWSAKDTMMVYGDGDNTTLRPVVGIDITGHEVSHGVTQFSSNLQYTGEQGALNESFSDMMGTGVEFFGLAANANWTIGEGVLIPAPGYLRSMSNPKTGYTAQPDTYHGKYWVKTTGCNIFNDNCGVHTNSGVSNYWFYILSMGAAGTNDSLHTYNVTGLGINKALQIAYRGFTKYLTSTSQFINARSATIQAAEDLYGVASVEAITVSDAWCAVGLCAPVVTGISENALLPANISVYPNPSRETVTIRSEDNLLNATLTLTDLTGRLLIQKHLENTLETTLSLSDIVVGSYLLKIESSTISKVFKVIKVQ